MIRCPSIVSMTFLTLPFCAGAQLQTALKPNIVLIISDDHRNDWMGHKGSNFMETPNLDNLAKTGWSFPNAFCVAGVCSPSRASLFTGKYMHQASAPDIVWQNNSFLQLQEMFPQRLYEEGYHTGYIGKFHLGEEEKPKPGFDLWASFPFVGNHFDQTIWINGKAVPQKGFTDDNIAAIAVETIKEWAKSSQPFCLVVGLKAPHIPFVYPERMNNRLGDVVFEEPETFNLDYSESKPGLSKNLINAKTWPNAIPKYGSFQEWVRSYTRLASTIDESVGKIMEAVTNTGISENTIFIYTSDHGYSLGEFSLCEKHYAYEQIMRVPLIIRFPHQKNPGKPPNDMVTLMDIAPTLMDYCTGKVPADMEGKSWRILQESGNGKRKLFRDAVFFDFWHNQRDILPPMQAVRTEQYKLIKYEYQPFEELYDLVNDPKEKYNLINDARYKTARNEMSNRLKNWKKQTGWCTRLSQQLNSVYVAGPFKLADDHQEFVLKTAQVIRGVMQNKKVWNKLERIGEGFDLEGYIPEGNARQVLYMAIPLENRGKSDPFISLRFAFPEIKEANLPAFTAFFEGKEIYLSCKYKQVMNMPMIDPLEEALRKMFDLGYNPPLRPGKNIILLRMVVNNNTPQKWNVYVVGGLSDIKWL
jgi:arylsulfatase A-like enzyme